MEWGVGGDLGGLGEGPPQNLRSGGRPMYPPPNISRSSVIGCVWKYELSKKKCDDGIFCSEIEIFLVKKGPFNYVIYKI